MRSPHTVPPIDLAAPVGTRPAAAPRLETCLACIGIAVTLALSGMAMWGLAAALWTQAATGHPLAAAGTGTLAVIFLFFIYGSLVYQFTAIGYVRRRAAHRPASREHLDTAFAWEAAPLTILVPCYKEVPAVVRRTLLSAALQDYPMREVVLLIDDPANPASEADRAAIEAMADLPVALQRMLDPIATRMEQQRAAFESRLQRGEAIATIEYLRLADLYQEAARWLGEQLPLSARAEPGEVLLAEKVVAERIAAHLARADQLVVRRRDGDPDLGPITLEYRRIASLFRVRLSVFQRKRYANLSHESNKAMNLNAYIGLMGGAYREVTQVDGILLQACDEADADHLFTDAEYLITLDADSLLLPEYATRLIEVMERPGHERYAVVQTPYSSIPAASGTLEYVAGATTDIQYNIHQGFTAFGATYWVGANALLRKRALNDIAETDLERGYPITRYIQDRTVIEDTESSIDLVARGWQLFNYPERLAYSATPPDFGALLIQRRRWANGGLIILPKLLRHVFKGLRFPGTLVEAFFRVHYLVSIAAINIGILIVFLFPFEDSLPNIWLPLSALPYFYLYARDLARIGYRHSDVLRTYALNLMLIPVNLGGVAKSIQQGISRRKIPFHRTPKVDGRTAAPPLYVLAEFALLLWLVGNGVVDYASGHYMHSLFALVNAAFLTYAISRYIGLPSAFEDIGAGTRRPKLSPQD